MRWLRRGGVALAPVRGDADALIERLATTFRAAGVDVVTHRDAAAMKWSKVIANLVANATSGLLDQDPSSIYADPGLFEVERDQLREALAVMRARGLRPVSLPGTPVPLLAFATTLPAALARTALGLVVGSARGGKDPSLRGAVQLGGPTEAGWLNGAVARAGDRARGGHAGQQPRSRAWSRRRRQIRSGAPGSATVPTACWRPSAGPDPRWHTRRRGRPRGDRRDRGGRRELLHRRDPVGDRRRAARRRPGSAQPRQRADRWRQRHACARVPRGACGRLPRRREGLRGRAPGDRPGDRPAGPIARRNRSGHRPQPLAVHRAPGWTRRGDRVGAPCSSGAA